MSSGPTRRSSIVNIEEWLDKCSDEEPDSVIYDPDYANDVATSRARQKATELEVLYKAVTDACTKIGLAPEAVEERLSDIDDCLVTFFSSLQKEVQDEYDKLCQYKEGLLNKIQKMTSDLYLPPYIPGDNITLLQHCKRLKTEFNKLNVVREQRMRKLKELRDKQTQLCIVLGIKSPEPIKMQTDIPTDDELTQFARVISDLEKEEKRRKEKYKVLKEMIKKCSELLEQPSPLTGREQPEYSEEGLAKLTEIHSKLEAQYDKNQHKFEKLRDKLISLYDRLDITGPERDIFLTSHSTCKPSLMIEMEARIAEYEELKKQNIGKFIQKIRIELEDEYDRCFLPKEQKENFFALAAGDACEELLELFEKELERIKNYYDNNRDILEKLSKYSQMWEDLMKLEEKAMDPSRFNNRGGQLLKEEKQRKALQKGLPKIEKELLDLNAIYASQNGGAKFQVCGSNLDEFIPGCWDELNNFKEQEKRDRQRAKMTPTQKNLHTNTPMKKMAPASKPTPRPLKRAVAGGGSRLLGALSISEQEFQQLVVDRPTSAKRPNRFGFTGR